MLRTRISAAVLLCAVGALLCLVLLSTHYGVPLFGEAVLAACGEGGGCDIVSQSGYSAFLGLPLAAWGLFFYGSVLALLAPSLLAPAEEAVDSAASLGFALVALALALDLVLFGIQAFLIKAFCKFCLGTYAVNLLLAATLWPFRQTGRAMNFLFTPGARRALGSWVLASLAVAVAALAFDSALSSRKALAAGSILGTPISSAAPLTAPDGSVPEGGVEAQLAEARAEAKKWKETLDDENKLQQYMIAKARSDFNDSPVLDVDLSRAPAHGSAKGPIMVVSYSDFMCPFCRDLAGALSRYLPTSGDRVRLFYKHFPLDMTCNSGIGRTVHPGACELAAGGVCAAESGRFWEYHDKVFARAWNQATREDVLGLGEAAGLNRADFGKCLDSATTKGRLKADIEEGLRIGVGSTPTLVINGRKLKSANTFFLALEEERKRLNLAPLPGAPPS